MKRIPRGARLAAFAALAALAGGTAWRALRSPPPFRVQPVRLRGEGPELAGDLYLPRKGADPAIALLFLHGSTPLGRKHPLYPALCERLAARGHLVLNLDQRGYGDSERLAAVRGPGDLDYVADARAVVRRLPDLAGRPVRELVLAGHSFGGGVAVAAGMSEPAVGRVISIAPGRRIATRFPADRPDRLAYVQQRRTRDLGLPEPIPIEWIHPMLASYDIGRWRGRRLPKPLLLVEGAEEPEADLRFSRELVGEMDGEIAHRVLPGADHYFGAGRGPANGGRMRAVSGETPLDRLAETLDRWLAGEPTPPGETRPAR